MKRLVCASLALLPLLLAAVVLAADDKLAETPYYPLRVGTAWHYKIGDAKAVVRVVKHEKVGDTLCARLEVTRDGKVVGVQHLAVTADGVYRHDLTDQHGEKAVTVALKPPILVLKLPPKKGESWKVDSTGDGKTYRGTFKIDEEKIKVPAGEYNTMRVNSEDLEINALKPIVTTYYASGVGMVKQVFQEGDAKVELVLEKFEAAK
jgi:hypothetical protein